MELTEKQKLAYNTYHKTNCSESKTCGILNISSKALRSHLFLCARKGYSVTPDTFIEQAPAGFELTKSTIQTNAGGDVVQRWDRISPFDIPMEDILAEFIKSASKHAPVYPEFKYESISGNAAEISIHDLHFGSLCWHPETGENYDIKIAEKIYLDAVMMLSKQIKSFNPERILFPVGSDFFNVNSKLNITVAGTQQDEDCRWMKSYVYGRKMVVKAVDILMQIAPVDIVIIPGNHDEERAYYLGDSLLCWYRNCNQVNVDNTPLSRKYWKWGKCLIGLTHGSEEVKGTLPLIMATEEPQLWAKTKYREWHTGHLHHKAVKAYDYATEANGIRERILPSLAATDSWHKRKGYSGLREAEAMIWNNNKGNIASFCYHP